MRVSEPFAENLKEHLRIVARKNKVSLRDVGKILSEVSLLKGDIRNNSEIELGWITVTVTLLISKIIHPEMYPKFLNATVTIKDLARYFDCDYHPGMGEFDDEMRSKFNCNLCNSWLYLINDGNPDNRFSENVHNFLKLFDSDGVRLSRWAVLHTAHTKYLNLFTTTRP